MRQIVASSGAAALALVLGVCGVAQAQPAPRPAHVLNAQSRLADVRALPDDALVRTRGGKVVPARTLKVLADAIKMAQQRRALAAERGPLPVLSATAPQAPVQVQVRRGTDLRALAARPDSDVIALPNGQKLTVGDFKKLSELQRVYTGTSLIEMQQQRARARVPAGSAIRIRSSAELAALAGRPDATVVENAAGRRITLGELRAYAKRTGRQIGG